MSETMASSAGRQLFPPTRWTLVLAAKDAASPESAAALEAVCRAYWYPLYAYVRRCGQTPHDAQDITQEFFRLLLEKRWLEQADREKGRLRSFLVTAMKRFMAKEWRRLSAQRRGGGQMHVAIDTTLAESRYLADPGAQCAAEQVFDRQWALTLLELTMVRLQAEYANTGKAQEFGALKQFLTAAQPGIDYPSVAARLGSTQGAARVAVHRLRKRFREIYREEITQTLPWGADVDSEMHHLVSALASS